MTTLIKAHHGQVLKKLIFDSGKAKKIVAMAINVDPDYISRLLRSEELSIKVRREASAYFNVPIEVFDDPKLLDAVNEPPIEYLKESKDPFEIMSRALERIAEATDKIVKIAESQAEVIKTQSRVIEKLTSQN